MEDHRTIHVIQLWPLGNGRNLKRNRVEKAKFIDAR